MNQRSDRPRVRGRAGLLPVLLAGFALSLGAAAAQDPGAAGGSSRERAALAEEQALAMLMARAQPVWLLTAVILYSTHMLTSSR